MRKRIMQLLRTRPYRTAELAQLFGVTRQAVRYHLKSIRFKTTEIEITGRDGNPCRVPAYYIEDTQ